MDQKYMSKATPARIAPDNFMNDGVKGFPEMGCCAEHETFEDWRENRLDRNSFMKHAMEPGHSTFEARDVERKDQW